MSSPMKAFGVVIGVLVVTFILYLLIAGSITLVLKTKIGQGDPKGFWYTDREKLKKYIFKSWIDWAGSPATFSLLDNVVPAAYNELKVISGASAKLANCMIQCESYSVGDTKCEGFVFSKAGSSNVCTLVAAMDVLMPSSGNTVYFVDGSEPANQFFPTASKNVPSPSNIPGSPYLEVSAAGCASNCVSNVSCNGFVFDTGAAASAPNCTLVSNYSDATLAAAAASITAYKLAAHSAFTASTTSYYSTSS